MQINVRIMNRVPGLNTFAALVVNHNIGSKLEKSILLRVEN